MNKPLTAKQPEQVTVTCRQPKRTVQGLHSKIAAARAQTQQNEFNVIMAKQGHKKA